jgi:hypothetical protein
MKSGCSLNGVVANLQLMVGKLAVNSLAVNLQLTAGTLDAIHK